jgi:acetylornithine deacetylase/succinyl-diaminopimelate desuccinylase-like protein
MQSKMRWCSTAISLAGAALLLAAQLGAQQPAPRVATPPVVDWAQVNAEALSKLTEYLRVDTSNPPGNEMRTAAWLARVFEAEGIPYEIGESAPGRGNIVARLVATAPQAQKEPALVLLQHMDVVPVSREYWSVDPFAGTMRDGAIWGRGAADMKGQSIAQLMAFLLLHRTRTPLRRDVIYLATADEEAGGDFGAGWVAANRPQWIAGARFLVNEGGRGYADESGKARYFGIGVFNKTPGWLKLTATGRPGHGSVPIADSAVNRLLAALERLRIYQAPLEVTPPIERAFASQALYEPEPWRSRLANIREYVKQPEARAELAKRRSLLALLTNTISITMLEGSNKINVIPPAASAQIDCRLLPGWTIDRWVAEVRRIASDDNIKIEVVQTQKETESALDTPLRAAIEKAVMNLHPGTGLAESPSTGFNDSHFFREKGIVSYGFVPFALRESDVTGVHGNDEHLPVKAFTDGVRLEWEFVQAFCRVQ